MEIRNVLCPVDFSDLSRHALRHAIAIADWCKAELTVMYVHHIPFGPLALSPSVAPAPVDALFLSPEQRAQWRQELERFTPADATKGVAVAFEVAEGDVALEIVARAESADILVMGTHGRSGVERLVLGSVAEKVLHRAPCALMTVPAGASDPSAALFRHVVAAIDFSEISGEALGYALSLAEDADARLTLLHVVEVPRELTEWAAENAEGRKHIELWRLQARDRLQALVPGTVRIATPVDTRIEVGTPYREILRVAAEAHADLVVMGTHGRGALERLFVGSTAQHVVRQAQCPVLTVRHRAVRAPRSHQH